MGSSRTARSGSTRADASQEGLAFADIMGVSIGRRAGLLYAVVSGEGGPLLDVIAAKFGITDVYPGCRDKAAARPRFRERDTTSSSPRSASSATTSTTCRHWRSAAWRWCRLTPSPPRSHGRLLGDDPRSGGAGCRARGRGRTPGGKLARCRAAEGRVRPMNTGRSLMRAAGRESGMKLSDYVMQFVAEQGVKHVFMLPGGGAMHLNDSLGRREDIEFVCNLHEQAAAIAAEAYAKVTNDLGVAMVTTGPGRHQRGDRRRVRVARLDALPVHLRTGQACRPQAGLRGAQLGVQEIDIVSIVDSDHQVRRDGDGPADDPLPPGEGRLPGQPAARSRVDRHPSGRAGGVRSIQPSLRGSPRRVHEGPTAACTPQVAESIGLLQPPSVRSSWPATAFGRPARRRVPAGSSRLSDCPSSRPGWAMDLLPETHPLFVGRPGSIAPAGRQLRPSELGPAAGPSARASTWPSPGTPTTSWRGRRSR